jgi:hypothetical protein
MGLERIACVALDRLVFVAQARPVEDATGEYLTHGLLGATCVILAVVVVFLFRDAKAERTAAQTRERDLARQLTDREAAWQSAWQTREREVTTRLESVQAQRVADAQTYAAQGVKASEICTAGLTRAASAMEAMADVTAQFKTSHERLADRIDRLGAPSPGRYPR